MTPGELRPHLVEAMLPHVPFDGWTEASLSAAARDLEMPVERARLAFGSAADMVEAFTALADRAMADEMQARGAMAMKVRERITLAVRVRLEQAEPHREAVRRALAVQAIPTNALSAARTLWRTADAMWRAAGDTATDYNHYTKRAILSGVYSATLLYWLQDESEGRQATWAFLDRRIGDVMRFEKVKAQVLGAGSGLPSLTRFLGRLRYPAR